METHRGSRDDRGGPGASGAGQLVHEDRRRSMRTISIRPATRRPPPPDRSRRARGQSLVEFALVLVPLFLLLLGVIQFGLIFNSYVTMTNAAREGARTGTVYVYDRTLTKAQNDAARNTAIRASLLASMNLLAKTSPHFAGGSTWTASGTTYTNGDVTITYSIPAGVTDSDPRAGQRITVRATYHQDLIIPLVAALLPQDADGRFALTGEVTMVIN